MATAGGDEEEEEEEETSRGTEGARREKVGSKDV